MEEPTRTEEREEAARIAPNIFREIWKRDEKWMPRLFAVVER